MAAKFDLIAKGKGFETWKPNKDMQEELRQDFLKAGFVLDAQGNIDLEATAKAGTVTGRDGRKIGGAK